LDLLPARAAELVERRRAAFGTDVLLHQADAVDPPVEAGAAGVLEVQVVALGAGDLEATQAAVDADAVVVADDVILGPELGAARPARGGRRGAWPRRTRPPG